jgi:glucose-6-phosphate dehydrogenase assembly protein OpcA
MEAVVIPAGEGGASPELEARFAKGIDLQKIRALLYQAREQAGLPAETVCVLNLLAVHFSTAAYERSKASLEGASTLHPARLISLIAEPKLSPEQVIARVSTVRPKGSANALEHIVLTAQGGAVRHLESAVTGLLVPEVPLAVVWGGRPEGDLLRHVAESADRVIIDSGTRPVQALADVAALLARGAPLGDLAWARIYPWQALAADVLDLPRLREHRGKVVAARVTAAGEPGPEAALLAGWFQSRVRQARVELSAGPSSGGDVVELRFEAPPAVFTLRRENWILAAEVRGDDDGELVHRVRVPPDAPGRLLGMELQLLSGQDALYAAAVAQAVRFLGGRGTDSVQARK